MMEDIAEDPMSGKLGALTDKMMMMMMMMIMMMMMVMMMMMFMP